MSAATESEILARWPQPLDEAAFFDLDKTVIAKDAMAAFGGPLRKQGLMKRRSLAQVVLAQVIYLILGSNDRRLDRIRAAVLRLTKGWSQAEVVAIVNDALESVVEPIIYDEAMDLIDDHHSAGRQVVIVSASPIEIVQPLGRHLGVDATIASEAAVDAAGCYTGELAFYAAGPQKADAVARLRRQGRDRPLALVRLQRLAHRPAAARDRRPPVAVNPDRGLAKIAAGTRAGRWRASSGRSACATGSGTGCGPCRHDRPSPSGRAPSSSASAPRPSAGGSTPAGGPARSCTRSASCEGRARPQSELSRLATTKPSATSTARISSFFNMTAS